MIATTATIPTQSQATGGRVWVRVARSSTSAESWRSATSLPLTAEGFTPNRVALKSFGETVGLPGTSPLAAVCRSVRNSAADWNRSNRSLTIARSTTASIAGDTAGLTVLGGTGSALTCW